MDGWRRCCQCRIGGDGRLHVQRATTPWGRPRLPTLTLVRADHKSKALPAATIAGVRSSGIRSVEESRNFQHAGFVGWHRGSAKRRPAICEAITLLDRGCGRRRRKSKQCDKAMNGIAAAGSSLLLFRGDQRHPTDTTRQPLDAELSAIAGLVKRGRSGAILHRVRYGLAYDRHGCGAPVLDDTTTAAMLTTLGAQPALTPAALTRVNDANVTLTLGGTPASALLQATSITAGWSGTLATNRGGFGADVSAANGVPLFTSGSANISRRRPARAMSCLRVARH